MRRVFIGRAVALREEFDGPGLPRLAKLSKGSGQSRCFLALGDISDGGRRTDAAGGLGSLDI